MPSIKYLVLKAKTTLGFVRKVMNTLKGVLSRLLKWNGKWEIH